ncbi:MAG: antitoxin family protein [Cyanobacteria bacterium P01_C01_bin.70]
MQQVVEAIYENGVLRPLKTLELSEGQEVQLTIRDKAAIEPNEMLQLAAEVYEGLSEEDIQEVEAIACDRSHFFEPSIES